MAKNIDGQQDAMATTASWQLPRIVLSADGDEAPSRSPHLAPSTAASVSSNNDPSTPSSPVPFATVVDKQPAASPVASSPVGSEQRVEPVKPTQPQPRPQQPLPQITPANPPGAGPAATPPSTGRRPSCSPRPTAGQSGAGNHQSGKKPKRGSAEALSLWNNRKVELHAHSKDVCALGEWLPL